MLNRGRPELYFMNCLWSTPREIQYPRSISRARPPMEALTAIKGIREYGQHRRTAYSTPASQCTEATGWAGTVANPELGNPASSFHKRF